MAQVPVSMQVVVYPRDKSVKPYPATLVGYAWITGLAPGGGPMPGGEPHPEHPIVLPPVDQPPPIPEGPQIAVIVKDAPESGGWGFAKDEGWYYSPGASGAGPKRR
jgi:hypothetical protein